MGATEAEYNQQLPLLPPAKTSQDVVVSLLFSVAPGIIKEVD